MKPLRKFHIDAEHTLFFGDIVKFMGIEYKVGNRYHNLVELCEHFKGCSGGKFVMTVTMYKNFTFRR